MRQIACDIVKMARENSAIPIIDPRTGHNPVLPAVAGVRVQIVPALPLMPKRAAHKDASRTNLKMQPTEAPNEAANEEITSSLATTVAGDRGGKNQTGQAGKTNIMPRRFGQCNPHANHGTVEFIGGKVREALDEATAFDIYARPFVPRIFTIINALPGSRCISTRPSKGINYDDYISTSLGPAAGFLPVPPAPGPPVLPDTVTSLVPRQYEAFFQQQLRLEAESEVKEVEACSLYGHKAVIKPESASPGPGQTLCTLQVPGLRENSPFVEEEDIVELRQLCYGGDGSLLGMSAWLKLKEASGTDVASPWPKAPGWTNTIYLARVLRVVRATETLHLRVLGLPAPLAERSEKFNVQFQLPVERHMPMCYALPEAQEALLNGVWLNSMLFPTTQASTTRSPLPSVAGSHLAPLRSLR